MKKCFKCKIEKPRSEFHKNKARPDGLQSYCKTCKKLINKESKKKKINEVKNNSIIEEKFKVCATCGVEKVFNAFHYDIRVKKRNKTCRECYEKATNINRLKNLNTEEV